MTPWTVDNLEGEEWEDAGMGEKREILVELFREGKVQSESGKLTQPGYKKAFEYCLSENGKSDEKTILHFLIRITEPYHVSESGKFTPERFYELVHVCLNAIYSRLGESGLYDTLHKAIGRGHFEFVEFVCTKMNQNDANLTRLISNAISYLEPASNHNCLRTAIKTDPRNLGLVDTLVRCADSKAFEVKHSPMGDGNTPLHDFVSFRATRLKINRCTCRKCKKSFPDLTRDETRYTEAYVQVLRMMIARYPDALSTTNHNGQTPYTLYKQTRPPFLGEQPSDGLEFNPAYSPQDLDCVLEDPGTINGNTLIPDEPSEGNRLRRTSTSLGKPSKATIKTTSKKDLPTTGKQPMPRQDEHENWIDSRYLAQRVGIELLEACCSLPSWEHASHAIFGDPRDDQSAFQTHLKMEEALYDGIEKAHNFLEFNSILACVELRLANPKQEPDSNEESLDTMQPTSSMRRRLTPEQIRDGNEKYLGDVLKWLCEKGVKRILKLVIIDDQDLQCRDETIQISLKGWDVRYLDWNKQDLSIDAITTGHANKLTEMWLNWSGRNSVLIGWSDPIYGLKKQLPMLKEVHIDAYSIVESIPKMKDYLKFFKQRIESDSEDEIIDTQIEPFYSLLVGKQTTGIRFEMPPEIRARPNGQDMDGRGAQWAKKNQNNHRWMEAVKAFKSRAHASYTQLRRTSEERRDLDSQPIKVALIDDGVNPSKLQTQSALKKGWPPNTVHSDHRNVSTYYNSSEGHGTTMANLILFVCPLVHLYVAKLDRHPPRSYTSVVEMAADAVKWAVSEKVDVISMSWTIKPNEQNQDDIPKLTAQIQQAEAAGISLFCSSDDIGAHEKSPIVPGNSTLLKCVGSCDGDGNMSKFVSTRRDVHYLFPGEQLPVMHQHLKGKDSGVTGDRGSSASTALAAGLAALILWCTVRSGHDRREFANKRMYALFDKLQTEPTTPPSLVDVSALMNEISEKFDDPLQAVQTFVHRLQERIPTELRDYRSCQNAA